MDNSPTNSASREELAAILRWYAEMGVDLAVDETPHDRFEDSAAEALRASAPPPPLAAAEPLAASPVSAPLRQRPAPIPVDRPREIAIDPMEQSARERAAAADTLEDLRAALGAFEGCGLKRTATQLVFSDGNPDADIMLVGEAPGADEDRQGRPFVGRAGQLLDRMLAAIGLDRASVYIANVVPWRPPGNRAPTPQETALCMPFTLRQIALANPRLLVCLGNASAQALLGYKEGITRARGRWVEFGIHRGPEESRSIPAVGTLHPAYLLRRPAEKRLIWQDLRDIKRTLEQVSARG